LEVIVSAVEDNGYDEAEKRALCPRVEVTLNLLISGEFGPISPVRAAPQLITRELRNLRSGQGF
jgi:hypothetical protein